MTKPFLASVEVNPEAPSVASVISMHGLGANGYDFASVPPQLGLPSELAVRYVFPHAPSIPVTINQGCIMPAWYDIKSFDARGQDEPGIRRNAGGIRQLIAREVEGGVAPGKIVVAGFSQGGAMALFTGLRHPQTLAAEASEANWRTPIFQAHGSSDLTVPIELGTLTRDGLADAGYAVEWHEYPMQHQVCPEELHDIGRWLTKVLRFDRET